MSATAVTDVLDRSMRDDAFLDAFRADPDAALAPYDLTEAEREALLGGDDELVHDALGDARLDWDVAVTVVVVAI